MDSDAIDETIGTDRGTGQQFFLDRLMRLVELRARSLPRLNDPGARLVNRAIYSTYLDCHRAGAGKIARTILEQAAQTRPAQSATGPTDETV